MTLASKLLTATSSARPLPTFVSASSSRASATSNTVTAPSGIQNGDLLVAVGFHNSNGISVTPPSGFNVIYLDGTLTNTMLVATKVASGESGNYTWTWSGTTAANSVAILVYRNATAVNTIGTIARASSATGTASAITPTFRGVLCAAFGNEVSAAVSTPPSGLTQRALQSSVTAALGVYDLATQEATATSSYSLVWGSSGSVASLLFQITNEISISPTFVASASTQNSTTGASLVISKPTGTSAGDIMVAVMCASAGGGRQWTGDTGWTETVDQSAKPSIRVAYKVAGSSEPSSYTFTSSNTGDQLSGAIMTYRDATYDATSSITTTTPTAYSLTTTASQSRLFSFLATDAVSTTFTPPTSMTARITDNDATAPGFQVCEQVVHNGPTGTRGHDATTGTNGAVMFSLKPTRSL